MNSTHLIDDVELAHRVALVEEKVRNERKHNENLELGNLAHRYIHTYDQVGELQSKLWEDVKADSLRVAWIWEKLWEALSGDIERDQTWEMFMDAIPGMPDLRTKTYEVEFRFDSITITVEAKDEDEAYDLAREEFETEYDLGDLASDARFFVTEV